MLNNKKYKLILTNLILLVGSCSVFFLIGEVVIRNTPEWILNKYLFNAGYMFEYGYPKGLFWYDKGGKHQYSPNFQGFFRGHGYEDIPLNINSHGLRDHEFSIEKKANTYRILALGDSITVGAGVSIDNIFLKKLEKTLWKNFGEGSYEVINAAVNSYGNLDELIFLEDDCLKYKPDLVIVGYCLNDLLRVANNHPYSKKFSEQAKYDLPEPLRKKLLKIKQAEVEIVKKFDKEIKATRNAREAWNLPVPFKSFWFRNSRLFKVLSFLYDKLLIRFGIRDYGVRYFNFVKHKWLSKAWDVNKLQILEFQRLARENNFRLLFLIFAEKLQFNTTDISNSLPQIFLGNFLKAFEIPFVDFLPVFKDYRNPRELFLPRDGLHLSVDGHHFVADYLYQYLIDSKMISAKRSTEASAGN